MGVDLMKHLSDHLLQEYVDSVLDDSDNRTVDEHLSGCLICNNRKKELVALGNMLAGSGIRQPSADFNSKVMSRIAALNFSPAAKKESSFIFNIPYLFAAALVVLVTVSVVFSNLEIETGSIQNNEVQSISKGRELANQYLSKITDIAEPIENFYSLGFLKEMGDTSLAVMILVFVGSILFYQLFELFHDKWLQRKWITHMMI